MVNGWVVNVDDGLQLIGSYLHDLILRCFFVNRKVLKVQRISISPLYADLSALKSGYCEANPQ